MQITQAAISARRSREALSGTANRARQEQSLQFDQIIQQVSALPGVKSAGGISTLPLATDMREASRFLIEGQPIWPRGSRPVAQIRTASPEYFATVGIPLQKGRLLTRDDWAQQDKIVVNDTMARRFFGNEDPIGHRVNFCSLDPQPCWFSIVGIVGNVHQFGLELAQRTTLLFYGRLDSAPGDPHVVRSRRDRRGRHRRCVHRVDPSLPVTEVTTLDGLLSRSISPRRFSAVLIGVLAGSRWSCPPWASTV